MLIFQDIGVKRRDGITALFLAVAQKEQEMAAMMSTKWSNDTLRQRMMAAG
jgi:hypothetical protein